MRQRKLFPTTLLNPFSEQLAKKARESIIRVDENESVEARRHAESAVKAAEDVLRGNAKASFGQSQHDSRAKDERWQIARLRSVARVITPSGRLIANEGEHRVHGDADDSFAHKSTNNLRYGLVLDQDAWKPHRKLAGRPALPSEYLWRLGLQNAVFEDAIKLTAIGKENGEPTIHTRQPWVKGLPPEIDEVESFMQAQGFEQIPSGMMASGFPAKLAWYRSKDEILVYDAKEANFVKQDDDTILPIDLVTQIYPVELMRETAQLNNVLWPALDEASFLREADFPSEAEFLRADAKRILKEGRAEMDPWEK